MKLKTIKPVSKDKYKRRQISTQGSSSSVYNYRSSRNESARPYNRTDEPGKKPVILKASYWKYVVASAVFLCLIYLLVLMPSADIQFSGQASVTRPENAYNNAVNKYLSQSIGNYSKLTFNAGKLSDQIKAEFPEITEIKVIVPLFNRQPKVEIMFGEPAVLLRAFDGAPYIVDRQGRVLAGQSDVPSSLNLTGLITVNDTSNQKIELGKTVLTEQQISFITETSRQAAEAKLQLEAVNLVGGASELNVKYKDVNYQVKYSFFADARQSSGAYFAIRKQLDADKKQPKEYVDLRIPERAYIK